MSSSIDRFTKNNEKCSTQQALTKMWFNHFSCAPVQAEEKWLNHVYTVQPYQIKSNLELLTFKIASGSSGSKKIKKVFSFTIIRSKS